MSLQLVHERAILSKSVPTTDPKTYQVHQVIQELAHVRTFQISLQSNSFRFIPGQHVVLSIPGQPLEASVAISSSPHEAEFFSVTVRRAGQFGTYFYDSVRDGDFIQVSPANGMFRLAEIGTRPICFIARDHGIASARSFARYLAMENKHRSFTLIHELSAHSEILFDREFQDPKYRFMRRRLYLDSSECPNHWNGQMGSITSFVILNEVPDFLQTEFYLAGEGPDIRRIRSALRELNIPLQQIHTERT